MKIISSKVHGILDYLTVIFLFLAPILFDMNWALGIFTYILASIHLLLTICTHFEWGIFKLIPFRVHGLTEFFVAVFLIISALFFRHASNMQGFFFYIILAAVFFLVFTLTDYSNVGYNRHPDPEIG